MFYIFVLPAHAGVIPAVDISKLYPVSSSRTRGGDPDPSALFCGLVEFFPHTRG